MILKEFIECYLDNLSRYVEQVLQQPLGRYNEHVHNIRRVFGRLSHLYLLNSECSRDHLGLSVHPPLSAWTMYIDLLSAEKLFMRVFDSCETNILSMVRNHSRTFKGGQIVKRRNVNVKNSNVLFSITSSSVISHQAGISARVLTWK